MTPLDIESAVFGEILLPDQFAFEIERGQLAGAEPCVDPLAVGYRARRSQIVLFMGWSQAALRLKLIFPELSAGCAIERRDEKRGPAAPSGGAGGPAKRPLPGFSRVAGLNQSRAGPRVARPHLRGDENVVTPDD